jgi:tetratricopeptide (TPR) repeat protein
MEKMRIFSIVLALGLVAANVNAQFASLKRADESFEMMAYEDAATFYERASSQGANELEFVRNLAVSYRKLRDFEKAELWYTKLIAAQKANNDDIYYFSEVLRSNGKYAESEFWLEEYRDRVDDDSRVARQLNAAAYLDKIWFEPLLDCRVRNLDLNTEYSDMGPVEYDGKLYFASSRPKHLMIERTHSWNDMPFLDLYTSEISETGDCLAPTELKGPFNTKFHESNLTFAADGKRLYFTRNNYYENKAGRNKDGINNLKIYYSDLVDGEWTNEKPFEHNSNEYSVGHPSLSKDGSVLYFVSDMPGGFGGTDIYFCRKSDDGSWGQPFNLGPKVNTEGAEMFPSLYGDGTLYFASDGHQGLGGLDILAVRVPYCIPGEVENLGAPVNSGSDDFGFVLNEAGVAGYFTSNRQGGKGDDDVYSFVMEDPMRFEIILTGRVILGIEGPLQPKMEISLHDREGALIHSTITDDFGEFEFRVDKGMDYSLVTGPANEIILPFDTYELEENSGHLELDVLLPLDKGVTLWAVVQDLRSGTALEGVKVKITDTNGAEVLSQNTNLAGKVRKSMPDAELNTGYTYTVELEKLGFVPKTFDIEVFIDEFGEIALHEIAKEEFFMAPFCTGTELGGAMALNPIYFEHNSSEILSAAAKELDRVYEAMVEHQDMWLECSSHTSASGSKTFNEALSRRRAQSTVDYLVAKGIDPGRLIPKGYGETMPANECIDGVECSEKRHAFNRRTEFTILTM